MRWKILDPKSFLRTHTMLGTGQAPSFLNHSEAFTSLCVGTETCLQTLEGFRWCRSLNFFH